MKKTLIVPVIALCFAPFFVQDVSAEAELNIDGKDIPVGSSLHQSRLQKNLEKAIKTRQKSYYNARMRTRDEKNIYYMATKASMARRAAHVEHSTDDAISREGALTNWRDVRTFQEPNAYRPNAKAVFRRCVVNYYFEGGACTPEEMKQGLVYSSTHEVNNVQNAFWTRDMETINRVRDIQRNLPTWRKVGAGQQGLMRNDRSGDTSRDFLSPFTKRYFNPED